MLQLLLVGREVAAEAWGDPGLVTGQIHNQQQRNWLMFFFGHSFGTTRSWSLAHFFLVTRWSHFFWSLAGHIFFSLAGHIFFGHSLMVTRSIFFGHSLVTFFFGRSLVTRSFFGHSLVTRPFFCSFFEVIFFVVTLEHIFTK